VVKNGPVADRARHSLEVDIATGYERLE